MGVCSLNSQTGRCVVTQLSDEATKALTVAEALKLAAEQPETLRQRFAVMHESELADLLLDCRDDEQRSQLVPYIDEKRLGDVLLELPEGRQEELLARLNPKAIEEIVEHMDSDDAADLLQAVEKPVADVIIDRLEPEERRDLSQLLAHDEESAGGLMQAELFKVRDDWTVDTVLKVLRRWGREIENLNYIYVVDDDDRLTGVLPLHKLLLSEPDQRMSEIQEADFPRVLAGQDQEEVAKIFDRYDVLALPVVDEQGVLVGRITADDVIDVIHEEATEDMYRLAALSDEDDLSEPVLTTARRRGVWLLVNLGTAILASIVIAQFEQTIARIVALAVLMPIVASMGGIAGTQTLTVIVRGIALGRVTLANARRALVKEVMVGLVSGLLFACIMGFVATIWFPEVGIRLGFVIGAAMMINLFAAGLAGAVIPLTLQRLNIDPALASGTVLTTVTDVVGFLSFLGLASVFLL
ncbi:MAG: magnesium transporter [Zetaproteobacteria bacterium]|nr:MAG: magnesium transporter [Zetaproteobacteria bacterium]